ncbi:MAG TPA: tRNA (adenosine(37)-N6)-dimethylallyltransferase MiaA, partial [Candidatus Fusicatenibacter merdavium]|nr:tRNA (adenosine(37)-N6)-dimethylallyltransferase MiaA [Candidatus Fusicatenibacter merdavium]
YLVDVLDPRDEFNVARFQQMAREAMEEIYQRGQLPIIVGGTGFYIQALLKEVDFQESSGELPLRKELEETARTEGGAVLYERLKQVDPESARAIHPHNVKRVIRALEYYQETGRPISSHNEEQREKKPPYTYAYFVLNDDRARLYERIDRRVDRMIEQGLVEEVRWLKEHGYDRSLVSMQGLGYKELFPYLDGTCTLEEAVEIIKRDTRHFAKRQLTWFRREPDVIWIDQQEFGYDRDRILNRMLEIWEQRKNAEEQISE